MVYVQTKQSLKLWLKRFSYLYVYVIDRDANGNFFRKPVTPQAYFSFEILKIIKK